MKLAIAGAAIAASIIIAPSPSRARGSVPILSQSSALQCEPIEDFMKAAKGATVFKGNMDGGVATVLVQSANGGPWAIFILNPSADAACAVASGPAGFVRMPGLKM